MEQPLVIRLTLEHMQAQIVQALYPYEVAFLQSATNNLANDLKTLQGEV